MFWKRQPNCLSCYSGIGRPDSPLCPLLVEHTTPAVFTPDGVGLLEVGRGAAVAAQVLHLDVVVAEVGVEGVVGLGRQGSAAEAAARGAGRDGVAFAGHVEGDGSGAIDW